FLVQVVEGAGDGIAFLVGGTVEASPEARRLLDTRWRIEFDRPAQIAVATVTGDPSRQDFAAIARAAHVAAQVVEPGGRIVVLSRGDPQLGEGAVMLRDMDNPAVAARLIRERRPADAVAALPWLDAARAANLYLLSGL